MYELTTHNMPEHLIMSARSLASAIPTAVGLISDPEASVTVTFGTMSATIDGETILLEADYDGYAAHATFQLVRGSWDCTSAGADNRAMRALVLSVAAYIRNDGIIPGAAYSIAVNRLHLATDGAF